MQGALGNCWLISAVAALAQFPDSLKQLFGQREAALDDRYTIQLCKDGLWSDFTVDEYLPLDVHKKGLLYTRCSKGGEIWCCLLEKAMAKMHGSYHALKAGYAHEALMDLTGAPDIKPMIA